MKEGINTFVRGPKPKLPESEKFKEHESLPDDKESGFEAESIIKGREEPPIEGIDKKGLGSRLSLEEKASIGLVCTAVGGVVFGFSCAFGAWGSRGVKDVFTTQYNGKPAVIQQEDIRMGPDNYWILLDGRDKFYSGTFVSDNGKQIKLGQGNAHPYSVSDYKVVEE